MTGLAAMPVEKLFLGRSSRRSRTTTAVAIVDNPGPTFERPGCEVADQTIVVRGHLKGLADGLGGFGVLKTSVERLEKASSAARQVNAVDVAATIDDVAKQLPNVRTEAQAAAMGRELDALIPQVWDLGARCGKSVSPDAKRTADQLAGEVNAGRMTKEQAAKALSEQTRG